MFLMQYIDDNEAIRAALVEGDIVYALRRDVNVYQLLNMSLETAVPLQELLAGLKSSITFKYTDLLETKKVSLPVFHPNFSEILVSGVALTHKKTIEMCDSWYDESHSKSEAEKILSSVTSEKKNQETVGPRPVWFFKGFGNQLRTTQQPLTVPEDALDIGEEAELVAIYIIDSNRQPRRVGFALGNDHSDHSLEKENYYYLAQSKLRQCSIGPEIFIGDLPRNLSGKVVVNRDGKLLWGSDFTLGAENMLFSLETIEHHIFKHEHFCQPGTIHLVFLGADKVSCSDNISLMSGDRVEISSSFFPHSLVNTFVTDENNFLSKIKSL